MLVADDNPINRLVVTSMLERLGFSPEAVADGSLALAALRQGPYNLVLMDCHMPQMDGFAATRAIRASEARGIRLPIVALTASALPGDREHCLAEGMDDYLVKPISLAKLERLLARWLPRI